MREIHFQSYGETLIDPLALAFTLAMGVWLLVAKRERAVLPIALVATLVPIVQRVVIATLDFDMTRIMILFGWARIITKGEHRNFRQHPLDVALLCWLSAGTLIHVLREGNFGAFVYRLGEMFNAAGIYFMLRLLLRTSEDVFRAMRSLSVIAAAVGLSMVVENITSRNVFSIFGGVEAVSLVREGRLRCTGAFSHPIMAGTFGAFLVPILLMLMFAGKRHRLMPMIGLAGAVASVATSASSGPALALIGGFIGCLLWFVRAWMSPLRWTTVFVLTVIHIAREAPVWHLIGRASDLIGGTGYHRVRLISGFVDNWTDWFLLGVHSTAGWGWGLQDVTNQFVLEGVRGGFLTFVAFIAVLVVAFRSTKAVRLRAAGARHLPMAHRRSVQLLAWGLGVSLAAHCISWISVSYFGQMTVLLYMHYALIAALDQTPELRPVALRRGRQERRRRAAEAQVAAAADPEQPRSVVPPSHRPAH